MKHLIIEVIENHHLPVPRTITGRDGKPDRHLFEQKLFAHFGGAFPVEMRLSFSSPEECYPVGKYTLSADSFKVGRYGDLELDRYGIKLLSFDKKVA